MKKSENGSKPKRSVKSRVINAIGAVVCALLIPVMIVLGTLLIKSTFNPDVPPDFMGYTPLVVGTGSMSPEIESDDLVIVHAPEDPAALEEGTIVAYMNWGTVIVHRIVDVQKTEDSVLYIMQGDANNVTDSAGVTPAQILGEYHSKIEGIGDFVLFMQTPLGILLFVVFPMIAVFGTLYLMDRSRYNDLLKEQAQAASDASAGSAKETQEIPQESTT